MGTPSRSPRNLDKQINGSSEVGDHPNGAVLESLLPEASKEAGPLQFLIAVGGIYGSL